MPATRNPHTATLRDWLIVLGVLALGNLGAPALAAATGLIR